MLEEGQKAPSFRLSTDDGATVALEDFRGKPVVLYFYPKDDTPGCTREACARAGVVRKVFPKVRVDGHAEQVLEALRTLASE